MEDDNINRKFGVVKKELDAVSPSFCVAKWKQVTVHLDTGRTHSCHHPVTHKISLDEIKRNPSALHNTEYKKEQRKMMLEGQRPTECDYCWRVEDSNKPDSGTIAFSDRITKSADSWAKNTISEITNNVWNYDPVPSSMEVNFGSTCNLKCSYCNPEISSKWMEEITQYGGYELPGASYNSVAWLKDNDRYPIPNREYNPYVEAFWEWWPDLIKELKIFRITGGEPLLNKNTFKVLDYLIENPHPELSLSINSNLSVPTQLLRQFIEKMTIIQNNKCIKDFKLYTSCEAHGARAEYIRFGLDYKRWLESCEAIIRDIPDSRLTVMSTYNLLSITTFKNMLEDMMELKNKYTIQPSRPHTVGIDIPYIRYPEFLTAWTMPEEWLQHIEDTITWMYQNLQQTYWPPLCGKGFFDYEIKRLERVYVVCKEMINDPTKQEEIQNNRRNFVAFVDEHDRRRGTKFLKTFPEMTEYYHQWKQL
jgi:organic radical activating enzyme